MQDVRNFKLGHPHTGDCGTCRKAPGQRRPGDVFESCVFGMHLAREDANTSSASSAKAPPNYRSAASQMIAQDQTKNWDEIRSATEKINRGNSQSAWTAALNARPDIRDEVLHARQSRAAESLNSSHVLKRGVGQVPTRGSTKKPISGFADWVVHRIFNPRLVAADLPAAPQKLRRLCRASTFKWSGGRSVSLCLDNMARETVRKYQVQIESNGTPTKLVDLEHFLNVGEARGRF